MHGVDRLGLVFATFYISMQESKTLSSEVARVQDESRFQWVIKPKACNTLIDFL